MTNGAAQALALALLFAHRIAVRGEDSCHDAVVGDEPCYSNLLWAKTEGFTKHPEFYKNYTFLNRNSNIYDFQYVLSSLTSPDNEGRGWGCPVPCTLSPEAAVYIRGTSIRLSTTPSPATTTTTVGAAGFSGLPWWAWVLIVIGICCLLPLCALLLVHFLCPGAVLGKNLRGPSKKSKRSKAVAEPTPVAEVAAPMTAVLSAPSVFSAPQVYQASQVLPSMPTPVPAYASVRDVQMQSVSPSMVVQPTVTSQPMVMPQSVVTAQPTVTSPRMVMPPSMAAPVMTVQPTMVATQPASLFDQLDRNRDGNLSREEFQALMR
mmetsp:Transcript_29879/g.82026  ORF Transcript_29879/g.82026 Transcript_29879/m.82026 type:complete len:319 (-) Transcript_29879:139-1095(-)